MIEEGHRLAARRDQVGQTLTSDYIRAAQRAGRIPGEEGRMPWLVHGGEESYVRSGVRAIGWRELPAALSGDAPTAGIGTR